MKHTYTLALCLSLASCSPSDWRKALDVITTVGQGAQTVAGLLTTAEDHADAYFARHPDPSIEPEVDRAIRLARVALDLLNEALSMGRDVTEARKEVLRRYDIVRQLLDRTGILEGRGPTGGAETEAPAPEPFTMPSTQAVADLL